MAALHVGVVRVIRLAAFALLVFGLIKGAGGDYTGACAALCLAAVLAMVSAVIAHRRRA